MTNERIAPPLPTTAEAGNYIAQASAVLRMLRQANTMTYGDFAEIIGLRKASEAWHPAYMRYVSKILDLTAATAQAVHDNLSADDFARIVKPGLASPVLALSAA
ncbi:hypothetical protein [Bradyrhizobium sp. CB2312]|uniref:hypothetical protein n=1 Tax=Bradyrhizobium sp. CB2312 TaxID=3039155 RepID=UPI0024B12752|nr:hypothetical protein [Bradyrhizobium sp. CB2312]WFU75493.1 hypothetical protein QA642_16510 [Bradyrhizobium sp. CB2312]